METEGGRWNWERGCDKRRTILLAFRSGEVTNSVLLPLPALPLVFFFEVVEPPRTRVPLSPPPSPSLLQAKRGVVEPNAPYKKGKVRGGRGGGVDATRAEGGAVFACSVGCVV